MKILVILLPMASPLNVSFVSSRDIEELGIYLFFSFLAKKSRTSNSKGNESASKRQKAQTNKNGG
jgi:hypothetical protein